MQALAEAVAKGRAIFVVGTGLSMSSSANAEFASWMGFIKGTLAYIDRKEIATPKWRAMIDGLLQYSDTQSDSATLITAAGLIKKAIEEEGETAVRNWLRETIGSLTAVDTSWAASLAELGCPILTTNYDSLIEQATGRRATTWQDSAATQKILLNNSTDIGHIHGSWEYPDSIVLSENDYIRLLNSESAQELQKAASAMKSFVYLWVGSGLTDPNFSRLIEWHKKLFGQSDLEHFRLCRLSEFSDLEVEHRSDHITPVSYGDDYSDLPHFLESLIPDVTENAILSPAGIILDRAQIAVEALTDQVRMQSIMCENATDRETRRVEELLVPPVLLPVSSERLHSVVDFQGKDKVKRSDPYEVSQLNGVTLIVGEENTGLTTALQWLLNQASVASGAPPILVDFKKFAKGGRPLLVQVRAEARGLGLLAAGTKELAFDVALGVDNVTPYAGRLCDQMIQDLKTIQPRQVFMACRAENEAELVEKLEAAGLTPQLQYMGRLGRQDVVKLVSLASATRPESVASRVMSVLEQQHLPRTPFIISLLASILLAGNSVAANSSHTSLLDQYLSQLLGRGNVDEDARWSLDSGLREAVLADLAMLFVEQRVGSLPASTVVTRIEEYFEKRDISESALELLEYFRAQRVVRTSQNLVRFSHNSYLYLFAAKAAVEDASFREVILEDPTLFSPIIGHYASLRRQDTDLLIRMESYLDESERFVTARVKLREVEVIDAPAEISVEVGFSEQANVDDNKHVNHSEAYAEDSLIPYREADAFPLDVPEDLPDAFRYSIVLEVVSTVLRDCDQVPDPGLKAKLLRKVLFGWGQYLGMVTTDPTLAEAFHVVAQKTAQALSLPEEDQEGFVDQLTRMFPALFAMSGISATLSSRKLLKALDRAITDPEFAAEGGQAVAAAFLLVDIHEKGWVAKVHSLTADHMRLDVIVSVLGRFCTYMYLTSALDKADEVALLNYISELSVANYNFGAVAHRSAAMNDIQGKLRLRKLQLSRSDTPIDAESAAATPGVSPLEP